MSESIVSQSTYSSALRFGLSPIKPIEETYVEKIGRFKIIHKIIGLAPQQHYSYRDSLAVFYEDVLRGISVEPKFDEEKLLRLFVERSLKVTEETGIKKKLDKLQELRGDNTTSSIAEQHDLLIELAGALSNLLSSEQEGRFYANEFFNSSNFSLSYFGELMRGSQTYRKFLALTEYELRILRGYIRASMQRSSHAALLAHKQKVRELRPVVDAYDSFRTALMSLKTYVEMCNSEKIEDMFEPKWLNAVKVDKQEFQRLYSNYSSKLDAFRDRIFDKKSDLFLSRIDFNAPVYDMWKKMITLVATST